MDDNKLTKLFANALEMKRKRKMEENADNVIKAVQQEWDKRLKLQKEGRYKADTPDQGVLKTVGYKVGNDGATSLAKAIASNRSLMVLSLFKQTGSTRFGDATLHAFCDMASRSAAPTRARPEGHSP